MTGSNLGPSYKDVGIMGYIIGRIGFMLLMGFIGLIIRLSEQTCVRTRPLMS